MKGIVFGMSVIMLIDNVSLRAMVTNPFYFSNKSVDF